MGGALGYIGGLVTVDNVFCFATDNLSGTGNHDPVFAPVMVHLQAEAVSRFHFDAFNFVARPFF